MINKIIESESLIGKLFLLLIGILGSIEGRGDPECSIEANGKCSYRVVVNEKCSNDTIDRSGSRSVLDKLGKLEDTIAQMRLEFNRKSFLVERKPADRPENGYGNTIVGSPFLKDEPGRSENILLNRLHREFSALRLDLVQTKKKLRDTERILSRTQTVLNETRADLVETTAKFLVTEKRLTEETTEGAKVRTELDLRVKELNRTKAELWETTRKCKRCELDLAQMRTQNQHLLRNLEKERNNLEETRRHLARTLQSYQELSLEHENTTTQLSITRKRLVACVKGQLPLHCEFEDSRICGFSQDNETTNINWIRTRGSNPIAGPKLDHTCASGKGHYVYIDRRSRQQGFVARLRSPQIIGLTEQCVKFFYFMVGRYVGTLNVYAEVLDEDVVVPMWRIYGNQGDVWIQAKLAIPAEVAQSGYKVVFEGTIDRDLHGDIAIDDFRISDGSCDPGASADVTTTKHETNPNK